ncbi:glycerate kinase [Conexibacter woesei DSM 14684]|uniref:Glycerate kinase n=1 Tax=Conexibacter woesei (strain DSM 14684 / CCUG 47730 / CIP 108061 / JCM 11494 / NBRC 100937 / ID131577) TaxID=469383 RepID=D3FCD5_CONWI|nr:glycerate kinase [Conexibacter woesei DSM 14684]
MLCAPDKLRGALDARGAAHALAEGARAAGGVPHELPIADGGEGTLDAFLDGATVHELTVEDALGRPRSARLLELADAPDPATAAGGTFLVEAAEAVPLHALAEHERDVERASSYGAGELVRAALDRGARRILIAVGGVATVDGGAGALQALGARCPRDGAGLLAAPEIDRSDLDPRLAGVEIELLVDVAAPLTGPDGAAHRFGPQKGATPEQIAALDSALTRWADALGIDPATPGAGAAGGLGAAFQAIGARTVAGADAVLELTGFDTLLAEADLVLTAEGSVDASTLQGKAVAAVVAHCAKAGVPVEVFGGRVIDEAAVELRRRGARDVRPLGPAGRPLAEAFAAAADELAAAAEAATRRT